MLHLVAENQIVREPIVRPDGSRAQQRKRSSLLSDRMCRFSVSLRRRRYSVDMVV